MPSKSKTKGNNAELELCKYLTKTFEGSFTRVPNSGSFVGGKNAFRRQTLSTTQNKIYKGDLIAPDFMPKFVVESKFYADFRFHHLLQPGAVVQLDTWIEQCHEAVDDGDFWIILFKINLKGWYIVIPEQFADQFVFGNHCRYTGAHGAFRICDMKEFFTSNKAAVLRLSA